jgi:hypothetical protein
MGLGYHWQFIPEKVRNSLKGHYTKAMHKTECYELATGFKFDITETIN